MTIKINYGGNVAEVEGVPLSPDVNEYYDEQSGECNITFKECDCNKELVSFGCAKCNRAVGKYIKKLIETDCARPSIRANVTTPDGGTVSFWRNKISTVFMYTDEKLESVRDNWYFRFLKDVPPSLWSNIVKKYEYPCAFALKEAMEGLKPTQVLMNAELPMVLVLPNRYYLIAPGLWRNVEEVKEEYLKAEEAAKKEAEAKARQAAEMKARREGKVKESDKEPPARPVVSTREKRQRYRQNRPSDVKVYRDRPNQTLDQSGRGEQEVYHTTRGTRIRH